MTTSTQPSLIDAALNAAFPAGPPEGMTMKEARDRIATALSAVDWRIREEAAAGVLEGVQRRLREFGEKTGDRATARAYERVAFGD